jgi:hypothetical protein
MICQRCNKEEAKIRWVTLSGKPLQEHVQQLCKACFLKATEEGPDTPPTDGPVVRASDRVRSKQKKDLPETRKPKKRKSIPGLEGRYVLVGHTAIRWVMEDGRYKWGGRDIHDSGTYTASQPDEFSCIVELASEFLRGKPKQCRITRRGKTYTVKELPNGEEHKFKRDDDTSFLAESSATRHQQAPAIADDPRAWKQIEYANAKVSFDLTGESVVRAATIPAPPNSKTPALVRVTHSNVYGRVDSDVYVRLGDPRKPLGIQEFDTVSDWQKADLVEDLLWSDHREEWVLRSKAKGRTSVWSGTYEVKIQFPKGHQQIELKIISRVPEVCSIVLSNWKVYVR